jgi:hypothetical protein
MTLFWTVLAWMTLLVPSENPLYRHGALATAIVEVLERDGPLFKADPDLRRTASLLVAVAYRESTLDPAAIGDGGHSVCAFQIYDGPKQLLDDPFACTRTAHRMLKESIRIDRAHPLAFYARGPRYQTPSARLISDDRIRLAHSLTTH